MNRSGGVIHSVNDPAFWKGFRASPGKLCRRTIFRWEFPKNILGRLVDLIAKPAISGHDFDVEVDITSYFALRQCRIGNKMRTKVVLHTSCGVADQRKS